MAYTKGYDKQLFVVETHNVMHDRLQIVIQHPSTCSGKGASCDRYKTFHRWPLVRDKLEACGLSLLATQAEKMKEVGKAVDAAGR